MAGPIIALQFLILVCCSAFIITILIYTIRKRHTPAKYLLSGLLFLGLTFISGYFYCRMKQDESKASRKFLGYYKLERLDREKCNDCKIRLNADYVYDIFVNNKIVGQGKWKIETAVDIPGHFLKIENGPLYVVWEHDRYIESIDRTESK
jgi:hypothetical protein